MKRTALVRTTLVALGVGVLLTGCGGSEATLSDGREAWLQLDSAGKEELTRSCRAQAAQKIGDQAESVQTRQSVESVDLDALVGRIDQWYAEDHATPGSISETCTGEARDLVVTGFQSELEGLQEP